MADICDKCSIIPRPFWIVYSCTLLLVCQQSNIPVQEGEIGLQQQNGKNEGGSCYGPVHKRNKRTNKRPVLRRATALQRSQLPPIALHPLPQDTQWPQCSGPGRAPADLQCSLAPSPILPGLFRACRHLFLFLTAVNLQSGIIFEQRLLFWDSISQLRTCRCFLPSCKRAVSPLHRAFCWRTCCCRFSVAVLYIFWCFGAQLFLASL